MKLSHFKDGNPERVDVTQKATTDRIAKAQVTVVFPIEAWKVLESDGFTTKKGALLQTATIAGVMGAKKTSELIPLCHPIPLTSCKFDYALEPPNIRVYCTAKSSGQTGVEMEALTGANTAALTIYDMCKALSHDIRITNLMLNHKSGGKKDFERGEKA
jgi:cyclic pyranopterin phosphate synthase